MRNTTSVARIECGNLEIKHVRFVDRYDRVKLVVDRDGRQYLKRIANLGEETVDQLDFDRAIEPCDPNNVEPIKFRSLVKTTQVDSELPVAGLRVVAADQRFAWLNNVDTDFTGG